ncbi:fic/DOC family protein [Hirsutella rhossiliensis]|uniref:Fic/DOC family domain-containing protein n=1 Tax=Hirsutella rhossiliensis TaxID=111463 RepID=A0A9P8MY49_9HYPO|nr:fic/DOC family domain-containing protein [Hirsutella rhossiliensis]KAH0963415.1 fic/DOC family domain-containing protein [Hirsutella rhossiliensis]
MSSSTNPRNILLKKIYAPFTHLERDSPEYNKLAKSGKVWEDYHYPGDSERNGYASLNQRHASILDNIDSYKSDIKLRTSDISRSLIAKYAHQSVAIEDNKLHLGNSIRINDYLASTFFKEVDLASVSASKLSQSALPEVHSILPEADVSQATELRNHIVASHWVTETALKNVGTAGLDENEVQALSALIIKETSSEKIYANSWGGRVVPGDFRRAPITVRSNPLRVFPYPDEVPALMKRFFQWRDKAHRIKDLHPIVIACQATAYFLHIHPFPDGNGRVARLIMQDFLIRQGYFPVVFLGTERSDYLRMIKDAQDGNPEEFVAKVVCTQLEEMVTFGREFPG